MRRETDYNLCDSLTGDSLARSAARPNGNKPIYVLNGPNLNLLGEREPEVYGRTTLAEIGRQVSGRAETAGFLVEMRQTNSEAELIEWLQEARKQASAVILNAAGLSHTSVALLDAARALELPLIEVHLSNPYAREEYRHHSFISEAATGIICGLGAEGYFYAIEYLAQRLKSRSR
ncbi:MAG TPA: type II 3-dehydroquinate dehydratase [Rhizomicrobium sp.]|nr:type II 3-dehydroquinate dehydratase [Rhizomicrobium sp.]